MSRPKLDLTEYQAASRHHLTVQISDYDIKSSGLAFGIADTLQLSVIKLIGDKLEISLVSFQMQSPQHLV